MQMNLSPNYQIIVDRKGVLDTIEVQVEMTDDTFSDTISEISNKEKEFADRLKSVLGIAAKATFVSAGSIARSEGKAKRVIDRRQLV